MKTVAGIGCILIGGFGAHIASAQTVPDSSFESPDTGGSYIYEPSVPGVHFNNNAGVDGGVTFSSATPPDGAQYGFIQSGGGEAGAEPGSITFDVTGLTIGATYDVTFYGSQRDGYPVNPLDVAFDTTDLGTFAPSSATSFDLFTTGDFTAAASSGSLSFAGIETVGDYDTAFDKISINPVGGVVSAAPEPASWALLVGGVAMVGGVLRRRRGMARASLA